MNLILAAVLYLIAILISVQMLMQGMNRKVEFFSLRNFFLVGLIVYQVINVARILVTETTLPFFPLQDMIGTGAKYIVALVLFLIIFNVIYMRGRQKQLERDAGRVTVLHVGVGAMLTLSVLFVVIGLVLRFTYMYTGPVAQLVDLIGLGLLAVAAGLAGWAWMSHFWNIIAAVVSLAVLAAALSSEIGSFGRRDLLGIAAAFLFGAYHGAWKHYKPSRALLYIAVSGACGFLLLSAHTAVRVAFQSQISFSRIIEKLLGADLGKGAADAASGQDAGAISLWLMETRGNGVVDYDFLHSFRVLTTFWIPRSLWEGKPIGLALTIPQQAGIDKVAAEFNVGPGLIGHFWNDNPYIALPLYSILIAFAFRWLDNTIRRNPNNPFVVLPMGAALGQFIGLARGELGTFAFRAIVYMATSWVALQVLYRLFASMGLRMTVETYYLPPAGADENESAGVDGTYDPQAASEYAKAG